MNPSPQHGDWDGTAAEPCESWQSAVMLSAAGDELSAAEESQLKEHLAQCPACRTALERERELLTAVSANRQEPGADLLRSCRVGLQDALDREEEGGWLRRTFLLLPASWLSPRPAWSAAILLLLGFSVGILGPRLVLRHATTRKNSAKTAITSPSVNTADSATAGDPADPGPSSIDLRSADVAGINVLPAAAGEPPQVELQLKAQQPVTLQGAADDGNVKNVLLYVLGHSDRYCPDVRLDAVDALGSCSNDPAVRDALCQAVHNDRNAAVRLKALEALNGAEPQDIVRNTLLDALVDDQNPGVRIEAINALREMAARGQVGPDDRMLSVLRGRMENDPNTYIRLQSAAAIRDLGPREKF
jgi:hypothetical protein